ncbi:TPA: Fe-S cluster assembly protein SufB [Candidatus Uhrbacteria bacterium]|nr:Fe-S cluster assembly protein SufB [Candidatus Uhrbacteria bacterium]
MQPLREILDTAQQGTPKYQAKPGLSRDVVVEISRQKEEPSWLLDKRLAALDLFLKTPLPTWGPDLSIIDFDALVYFVRPDTTEQKSWDDVPPEIRSTFDKLGIPKAEQELLAGVGAQYDSDVIYHNLKAEWSAKGVIFENMDAAVRLYPDLVAKYFMTSCVPIHDHKFAMLHAAVWSGGTFIYVPPGVKVTIPLQAYFRMNAKHGGQFEHTLIVVDEGAELHYIEGCSAPRFTVQSLHAGCVEIFVAAKARMRYSSIENWSKNTFNLNTKRALVDAGGVMEWVSGNFGSGLTMLYPASILRGEGARSDFLGVAFAGAGQVQDTGAKMIHVAPNTSSTIRSKSVSKDGGKSIYRGNVRLTPGAKHSTSSVVCDALLLDALSSTDTLPTMKIESPTSTVAHEASTGRIGDAELFYLASRGLDADAARRLIVNGFLEPIVRELPLEYAIELNRLIDLEMMGSVG